MRFTKSLLGMAAQSRDLLMKYEGGSVSLQRLKDYGVITLSNKGKLNSLTGKMIVDFNDALTRLEEDTPRGVIIRGADGNFCTGYDLSFVQRVLSPDMGDRLCAIVQTLTTRLRALACPTVALVEGYAIGGGAELAIGCDWRAVTPKAKIEFRQSRIGLTTGWGGGPKLVHLVGRSSALRLLLSSSQVTCDEALRLGLADLLIAESSADPAAEVMDWLQSMYGPVDTETVHAMKRLINDVDLSSDATLVDRERAVFRTVWGGPVNKRIVDKVLKRK